MVRSLHQKDLLRDADKGGLQSYVHEYRADRKHGISGKQALSQINRQLETSSEGQQVSRWKATVNQDFKQTLYRSAGKKGKNFHAKLIKSGKIKASDLPDILKTSHEYRTWVAPAVDAYRQELGRTPGAGDRGGVEQLIHKEHWWSDHGTAGPSRFQNFDEGQIKQSPEYRRDQAAKRAQGGSRSGGVNSGNASNFGPHIWLNYYANGQWNVFDPTVAVTGANPGTYTPGYTGG